MSWKSDYICGTQNAIESDTTCPLRRTEDTTEHIMVCQESNNTYNPFDENEKDWEKYYNIYSRIINKIGKN